MELHEQIARVKTAAYSCEQATIPDDNVDGQPTADAVMRVMVPSFCRGMPARIVPERSVAL